VIIGTTIYSKLMLKRRFKQQSFIDMTLCSQTKGNITNSSIAALLFNSGGKYSPPGWSDRRANSGLFNVLCY
jgi:hypothetical protein